MKGKKGQLPPLPVGQAHMVPFFTILHACDKVLRQSIFDYLGSVVGVVWWYQPRNVIDCLKGLTFV